MTVLKAGLAMTLLNMTVVLGSLRPRRTRRAGTVTKRFWQKGQVGFYRERKALMVWAGPPTLIVSWWPQARLLKLTWVGKRRRRYS